MRFTGEGGCVLQPVRYAETLAFVPKKTHCGMYYTTKIWSFRMRTPCCQSLVEVRTDPKNRDYALISGAKRKRNQRIEVREDRGEEAQGGPGAFDQLERSKEQLRAAAAADREIYDLHRHSNLTTLDNYKVNASMRKSHRAQRKKAKALVEEGKALGLSGDIKLLPVLGEEPGASRFAVMRSRSLSSGASSSRAKKRKIRKQSIFS